MAGSAKAHLNAKIVLTSDAALTDSLDNSSLEAAVGKFDEQDQAEIENHSISSDQHLNEESKSCQYERAHGHTMGAAPGNINNPL